LPPVADLPHRLYSTLKRRGRPAETQNFDGFNVHL
jgi:hypothetical protein